MISNSCLKIFELEDLLPLVKNWKQLKETISLCHGCFDFLHYGHLIHFIEASELADHMIVSVTRDKFIKKGKNRPYFNENQRLSMVGAMCMVDAATLNNSESSVDIINLLQPDIYVKGPDYKTLSTNVNQNIHEEINAIKSINAKIYFTNGK